MTTLGDMNEFSQKCINLTKKLVAIPSVNSTDGEYQISLFIEKWIREIPYFQKHPEMVILQNLEDEHGCRNVIAAVKGKGDAAVIFHGHLDTVDIENMGDLKPFAFDCDALLQKMKQISYDAETDEDLRSGSYMVGRGVCDMKCGIALGMELLSFYAEHADELTGNVIFMANPGEESTSLGIMKSLEALLRMKETWHLDYRAAMNLDCSNPHYNGDKNHYLYFGTVGKLLPCFYILGKETHIGQCFAGIDASMAAAKIISAIHLNMKYADEYGGELSLPPSVLHFEDSKTHYSVNTAEWAYIYFNFLVYRQTADELLVRLKKDTEHIVDEMLEELEHSYAIHCKANGREYHALQYSVKILLYEELYLEAKEKDKEIGQKIDQWVMPLVSQNMDARDIGKILVQNLLKTCGYKENVIVLFLAHPFMPHSTLREEEREEDTLRKKLEKVVTEFNREYEMNVNPVHFYPSLSDSSYLKMDDDEEAARFTLGNIAGGDKVQKIPLGLIKALNIPALNMGCYGKDPHRNTERLETIYSFRKLPILITRVIDEILHM